MRLPGQTRGGIPPRLGMEAAARVRRRVHMRRLAARWMPLGFVLLAVGLAGYIARPRNLALERFLRIRTTGQPETVKATPRGMVTPDGAVDLSVAEGGIDRHLRITKGKDGWRVEEFPAGTQPEAQLPGNPPVSSVIPPGTPRPLSPAD